MKGGKKNRMKEGKEQVASTFQSFSLGEKCFQQVPNTFHNSLLPLLLFTNLAPPFDQKRKHRYFNRQLLKFLIS